ncbi:AAA family ATPase [Rhodococcus aetherivorans]|uniref:AAA family ATPase n=1 Tax=Rhodococcus aetherivorans TaxID=191292 RepID=UPI0029491ECC|nr:AAA family ATPase [Rhodococcus aetherivorans]MDV6293304.1 AAA family ATPase [Rhodococcus aetherivorans]
MSASVEPLHGIDYSLYFDVAALLAGDLPPAPTPLYGTREDGHALFYAGQVNLAFGDPEGGKTWVALYCAVEALRKGGRALVLDLDHNGPGPTVTRMLAMGADREALSDPTRFLYVEPEDRTHAITVVADMATWGPDVVVVDSLGELLPLFGSSSNSADDFTIVHTRILKPLAKAGACVIVIDHLSKGSDSRTFGPGGTSAKRRAVGGVSIRVRVKDAFTPGKGGSAYLSVNKDRHGGLRAHCPTGDREPLAGVFELRVFSDDVLEPTIRAPKDGESAPADFSISAAADPQRLAEDVDALDALDPPPLSQRDVCKRMKWGGQRATEALRAWRERSQS